MKPYTHHDPILDRGKALPHPHNPGSSPRKKWFYRRNEPLPTDENGCLKTRTRPRHNKKKLRVSYRDRKIISERGVGALVERRHSVKRQMRAIRYGLKK